MKTNFLILLLMLTWVSMLPDANPQGSAVQENHLLGLLKNVRLVFKDKTIRKNCTVTEIHAYWLVYEKEGSLHDAMLEKILRIELTDGTSRTVMFDENLKPVLKNAIK